MKKITLFLLFLIMAIDAKIITILDNGIVRKIEIDSTYKMEARGINPTQQKGLIVKLQKGVDPLAFAQKFQLKLKKALKIPNYYIFENKSDKSDLELIAKIIKEAKEKIVTIRPNYSFNFLPR